MRFLIHIFCSKGFLFVVVGILGLIISIGTGLALRGEGNGPPDITWERIQNEKVIVVGIDPSFPPFGIYDPNGIQGLDADLAKAIAENWGVQLRFVLLTYDGIFDTLYTGHVDMVIAALRPDPTRYDRFLYSRPYYDAGHVFVGIHNPLPTDFDDLIGKTLAVSFASAGDEAAQNALEDDPHAFELIRLYSIEATIQAILSGQADYALLDSVSARLAASNYPEIAVGSHMIISDPYVIAVRRANWRLFIALQDVLNSLERHGELAAIIKRWL